MVVPGIGRWLAKREDSRQWQRVGIRVTNLSGNTQIEGIATLKGIDMTTKLVLLRHGESVWNKEDRFTGWADIDLSETKWT